MDKKYSRRKFISTSLKGAAGVLAVSVIPIGISRFFTSNRTNLPSSANGREVALPIPPLVKNTSTEPKKAEFQLTVQSATKEFFQRKGTPTLGYNGDFLGPVIRVRNGTEVSIKVKNDLNEGTTVHWHGLKVNGDQDGGPHQEIQPGETWNPRFTINQPAATLWYHPHLLHKTGEQVYKGLAGLFYIDDDISDSLNLPNEYGVNDFPLVIQDRQFNSNGTFEYKLGMQEVMMGIQGNTILVNGAINPFLNVPRGKVRFRMLNGSNARAYEFRLSNNQPFDQIASDGGLLPAPVSMTKVILAAGERAEMIIDFSSLSEGDSLYVMNQDAKLMKFVVKNKPLKTDDLPSKLVDIQKINESTAVRTRQFVFQGMGSNVNINGKQMDMNRIDEQLKLHDTEIWEISNASGGMMGGGMAHPFHAHGVQFQILDRDGNPPPANEAGWKDTILVNPGEKVRAIATFDHSGTFMYHCHILEHEDAGMMGQFTVQ
ncbi:multicopper oxidase family protein [Neobacillus sp. SM06]|uniref:multicopper oxidase family protein n=1 Tax=Neobacillus sp. SM06 TaxID=3422492 RepID=UPI003D2A5E2C